MPHTIKDRGYHQAAHYQALRRNVRDGAWFACVSEATRRDLCRSCRGWRDARGHDPEHGVAPLLPRDVAGRARSPRGRSGARKESDSAPHGGGAADRRGRAPPRTAHLPYLLMVSTIEPRKNHLSLLTAWEQLRPRSIRTCSWSSWARSAGTTSRSCAGSALAAARRAAPARGRAGAATCACSIAMRAATSARASAKASTSPASRRCAAAASSPRPTFRCTGMCSARPASTSTPYSVGRPGARALARLLGPDASPTRGLLIEEGARCRSSTCPSASCRSGDEFLRQRVGQRHECCARGRCERRRDRRRACEARATGKLDRAGRAEPALPSSPRDRRICEIYFDDGKRRPAASGMPLRDAHLRLPDWFRPRSRSVRRRLRSRSSNGSGSSSPASIATYDAGAATRRSTPGAISIRCGRPASIVRRDPAAIASASDHVIATGMMLNIAV